MLSQKAKLCVKVLVAIACAPPGAPVTTRTLSKTLHVSVSYLESVARILREARLVRAARGPGGGYYLSRPADEISVWDVVGCVEPPFAGEADAAPKASPISALEESINATFVGFLASRNIGEFATSGLWDESETSPPRSRFRLRPMPQKMLPTGPSSVFDLSSFPRMSAA
ncbi:MAG: Rrf2 family transcriptional regulator [Hydrogenophaga sp.]|nr:Rrf2 family transcriptional regulator [Hydrogenophaga sp.]